MKPRKAKPNPESKPSVPVVQVAPQTAVEPRRKLWQAMFFTKDGRLDLGWLLLAISCLIGLGVFGGQAVGIIPTDRPSKEAWAWFGAFIVLAFVGGAARDRAALIAKGNVVGAVAGLVGSASVPGETEKGGE